MYRNAKNGTWYAALFLALATALGAAVQYSGVNDLHRGPRFTSVSSTEAQRICTDISDPDLRLMMGHSRPGRKLVRLRGASGSIIACLIEGSSIIGALRKLLQSMRSCQRYICGRCAITPLTTI